MLLLVGVNTDACQRWLAEQASQQLTAMLHGSTKVERVAVGLLNQVTLYGVQLDDPHGHRVLRGEYVSAKFDLYSIIHDRRVAISTIALLDTKVDISKEHDGRLNIQYLIDAFSNPNDTTPSQLNLSAGVVIMRRCHMRYEQHQLSDIDLNLSLRHLTNDSIALRVRHCSLKDDRGLTLSNLSFRLEAGSRGAQIQDLGMRLPHSQVRLSDVYATWRLPHRGGLSDIPATLQVSPCMLTVTLNTDDIKGWLPRPLSDGHILTLNTRGEWAQNRLRLSNCQLAVDNNALSIQMDGTLRLSDGRIHDAQLQLHRFKADMSLADALCRDMLGKTLPQPLLALEHVEASGSATLLDQEHGGAHLEMHTAAGSLMANARLSNGIVTAQMASSDLTPNRMIDHPNVPSLIDFTLNGSASLNGQRATAALQVNHLVWHGEDYPNIQANGSIDHKKIALNLAAENALVALDLNAQGDLKLENLKLDAEVTRWRTMLPKNILSLTGKLSANAHQLLSKRPTGELALRDFCAVTREDDTLRTHRLHELNIRSQQSAHGVNINLASDFLRAQFSGEVDIPAIRNTALHIVHQHLPELIIPTTKEPTDGRWNFALNLHDTKLLHALFGLPATLAEPLSLEGYINGATQAASVQVNAPAVLIGSNRIDRLRLYAASTNEGAEILMQATKPGKSHDAHINLESHTLNGIVNTRLNWREPSHNRYHGEVAFDTRFGRDGQNRQTISTQFLPTTFAINDTLWCVSGGALEYADKRLHIKGCEVNHGLMQRARIDGCYSSDSNDSIVATLRNIDVKYILDLVNFTAVVFEGKASGSATLRMREGKPHADFDIQLPQLFFNYTDLGQTHILGDFDSNTKRINLHADMDENGLSHTRVDGYVSIAEKGLDLQCQAQQTPIAFINYFVEGILDDVQGRATGPFHLYGPFKKLDFGGDLNAQANVTIPWTGVRYSISNARAHFEPGLMQFVDGRVTDNRGGSGRVAGQIRHEHIRNMCFHFEADMDNALVYDKPQQMDWNFFATACGSGHVVLDGQPGRLQVNVDLTPTQGTDFTFINDTPETVSNIGHVHFGSKKQAGTQMDTPDSSTADKPAPTPSSAMDIYLNFNINVNPSAALHIIMDEKCGDVINLYGKGAITATYYNKGDFMMYGTCTVDHGEYRFSIQDIIRKNFVLKQGGEVIFAGNPMDANLDVQAVYTVNSASLSDLNAGTSFTDNNVRVNCLLNIQGKAGDPQISFDLDLPTVNEDEKQMVRKLIATEEDMNMQIIYLLGVGRFYTFNAESQMEGGANMLATNSVNSFISNTLSSQLNEILSNAMRSNNWSFGTNLATGSQGWNDLEVEAILSGRLFNNRLLLNGQFGYRDKATVATSTNFIGDFDIQYLLTKNGNIRLKAYSETNDRYFTKSALTTQGIGIMLQKDFGRLEDQLKRNKLKRRQKNKSATNHKRDK